MRCWRRSAADGIRERLVASRGELRLPLARLARTRIGLPLALHTGRLIVLAAPGLRQHSILLDFAAETLQSDFERVALPDDNLTHAELVQPGGDAYVSTARLLLLSLLFYHALASTNDGT